MSRSMEPGNPFFSSSSSFHAACKQPSTTRLKSRRWLKSIAALLLDGIKDKSLSLAAGLNFLIISTETTVSDKRKRS